MASFDHINQTLMKVSDFLAPLVPLVGCHMVDFLTLRHWDTLLPPRLQADLLHLPQECLQYLPSAALPQSSSGHTGTNEEWCLSSSDLQSFLSGVRDHCLPALGVTTPLEEVLRHHGHQEINILSMKGVMSLKKSHEVEVMGQMVARLAKGLGVEWIVDLGSGRGYLSTSLVLQYGLRVVAIDSRGSNTTSALVRNDKLQRQWDKLKQTWKDRLVGKVVKKGKSRRKRGNSQQQDPGQENIPDEATSIALSQLADADGCYLGVTEFVTENTDLLEIVNNAINSESATTEQTGNKTRAGGQCDVDLSSGDKVILQAGHMGVGGGGEQVLLGSVTNSQRDGESVEKGLGNLHVSSSFPQNITQNFTDVESVGKDSKISQEDIEDFHLLSENVSCNTMNTANLAMNQSSGTSRVSQSSSLGLIGLHTCGNLASSSLRLFVSNPKVDFLCNVGCCYHLIEEEFSRNTFNQVKVENTAVNPPCDGSHTKERNPLSANGSEPFISSTQQTNESTQSSETSKEMIDECLSSTAQAKTKQDIDPLCPSEIPDLGYGFPMSSLLRGKKYSIGRNCRMLASQAPDRLLHKDTKSSPDSLYWRALLQVVLSDKLGDLSALSHVGRLSAKCQTFPEYAKLALSKLRVLPEVTVEELEDYDLRYMENKDKLERFFLLRSSLAPVIEGVMLLDRLAYLNEQDNVSAHLVQLFDPVTSPRSHALLALRAHQPAVS